MKHPLFNPTDTPLSPQEEREITRDIAKAYRKNELSEKRPEFQRILQNVEKQLLREGNRKQK
ncbi:MAG: hypothetical protein D4R65_09090 [Verrucomicrobiaceae bacterium]|nr:MAG: hypothetical protein D4R65_09090 [Verrucomicrobiaceae bacterium]